tara:strand:+ start:109 stop:555 length:447 start_codon:yes stop_codon:yes gene_type:complete
MTLRYTIKETIESPTFLDYPLNQAEQLRKDVLASEEQIFILCDDPALRYAREHMPNGLGTRKFEKLCETNFGYADYETVVAFSVDKNYKVLRTWYNKYMDKSPEGDLVSETVFFSPKIGKESIRYYSKDGRTRLETLKESLEKGLVIS